MLRFKRGVVLAARLTNSGARILRGRNGSTIVKRRFAFNTDSESQYFSDDAQTQRFYSDDAMTQKFTTGDAT